MKTLKPQSIHYLFDHILDGYKSSYEGIIQLKERRMITDQELTELLTKNSERLIRRIIEFKLMERLLCVFFAALFGLMQVISGDLEMRKAGRIRLSKRKTELYRAWK